MKAANGLMVLFYLWTSSPLCGQLPSFQKEWQAASNHPAMKTFLRPIEAEAPNGTWSITASINPDYWYFPAYFHLSGSYRTQGGSFTYREVIIGLPLQIALLKATHPKISDTEIEKHLLFAELYMESSAQLPAESQALIKALKETQGTVLPSSPGALSLHPTTYSVSYKQGNQFDLIYTIEGWRGRPQELEYELSKGLTEAPLVVVLNRLRQSYLTRWKEEQRQEQYRRLLDRVDLPALGVATFSWACAEGEFDLAEALIARGLPPDRPAQDGSLPLIAACLAGNQSLASKLFEGGAHLDDMDADGWTPLAAGCASGNLQLIEWLMRHGIRPQYPTEDDSPFNSIRVAVNQDSLPLVQAVFQAAGPVPDPLKLGNGVDLLASAVSPQVTRWLLGNGFKPTPQSLQNAARMGSVERMKALLDAGADPNLCTPFSTPLMEAIESGRVEAVELLLTRGSDPRISIPLRIPGTPLEKAKALRKPAIVELLTKALGKLPPSRDAK